MSQTETFLLFVLGFSLALFLALLFGRSLWALMGSWSNWRESNNAPAAMQALEAERDRLKAEKAMMAQKLEVTVGDVKMRMAEQTAEVSRNRNRMLGLEQTIVDRDSSIAKLEHKVATMEAEGRALQQQIENNVKVIDSALQKAKLRDEEHSKVLAVLKETQLSVLQRDDMIKNMQNVINAQHQKFLQLMPSSEPGETVLPAPVVTLPIADHATNLVANNNTVNPLESLQFEPVSVNRTTEVVRAARNLLAQATEVDNSMSNVLTLAERVRKVKFGSKS
jgi:hypothetical protein